MHLALLLRRLRTATTATATRPAMASVVQRIHARQIFDSRGNPTVEVDLTTAKGACAAESP